MHSSIPFPFPLFFILFFVIFAIVVGGILINIFKGVGQWASNNAQPVQTEQAKIVAKRTEVSGGERSTSTTYYATFELPSGQRRELQISGADYGQFAEGDIGGLTLQGTRFLGFTRQARPIEAEPPPLARPEMLACAYCGGAIPAPKVKCESCGWTWRPASPPDPVS